LDGLVYLRHFVADGLFRVQKPIDRELSGVQLRIVPHLFGHFRLHVLFFSNVRSVQYVAPPFPNHPKKEAPPWLICLRSGKSEESKRLTYSAFFTDKYVSSRYSAIVDRCGEQIYHPL
jgi:hypothetical protein